MSKWTEELLFVRRGAGGAILDIADELPEGVEYEPYDPEYDPCLWDSNRIEATKTVLFHEHIEEAKA